MILRAKTGVLHVVSSEYFRSTPCAVSGSIKLPAAGLIIVFRLEISCESVLGEPLLSALGGLTLSA